MAEQKGVYALFDRVAESPVFNDAGRDDAIFPPEDLREVQNDLLPMMTTIAMAATERFGSVLSGNPQRLQELSWKAAIRVAICKALLTLGQARPYAQAASDRMVVGMYIPNDLVDGGDELAGRAMTVIDVLCHKVRKREEVDSDDPLVWAFAAPIHDVKQAALPDDQPFLLDGVYQRILRREVGMRRFSHGYTEAEDRPRFIARHAKKIAEISSISSGARDIADSVYALTRQEEFLRKGETDLPSLANIEKNDHITTFRRVLNTYARLMDDLGDHEKDGRGVDGGPDKEKFSLNVFNQDEPELKSAYLDLLGVEGERREELFDLISQFAHEEDKILKDRHKARIIHLMTDQMRESTEVVTQNTSGFEWYITMSKRVATICHVNVVGDDNMSVEV